MVFLDVTMMPCDLVDRYQRFTETNYFHLQGRRVESSSSETLEPIYQIIRIPEDLTNLRFHCGCRVRGSHSDDYEERYILGYNTV